VQVTAEPASPMMDGLRAALNAWLGPLQWKQTQREHFSAHGFACVPFDVAFPWYRARATWRVIPPMSFLGRSSGQCYTVARPIRVSVTSAACSSQVNTAGARARA
jgi:hypothetical protein